jgi:hypothetical protein
MVHNEGGVVTRRGRPVKASTIRIVAALKARVQESYRSIAEPLGVAPKTVEGVANYYGLTRDNRPNIRNLSTDSKKQLLISALSGNNRLSGRTLERMTGVTRNYAAKLLLESGVIRRGGVWIIPKRCKSNVGRILPEIVLSVLHESRSGAKASDIALKHGIGIDQVLGIRQGRYDSFVKVNRAAKRMVRVRGVIQIYDEKGYEPSGESIKGALELSDDQEQLKCHECGDWFENLAKHVMHGHDMRVAEYKRLHGLKKTSALVNERLRVKMALAGNAFAQRYGARFMAKASAKLAHLRKNGFKNTRKSTIEQRNARRNCPVQVAHDLRTLAEKLHRRPTHFELRQAGISESGIRAKYGTIKKALDAVCANMVRKPATRWYSNEELLELLKMFREKYKRPPFASDTRRGLLPSWQTFAQRFGSWNKALVAAGFPCGNVTGWIGAKKAKTMRARAKALNAPTPRHFASSK